MAAAGGCSGPCSSTPRDPDLRGNTDSLMVNSIPKINEILPMHVREVGQYVTALYHHTNDDDPHVLYYHGLENNKNMTNNWLFVKSVVMGTIIRVKLKFLDGRTDCFLLENI